MVSQPGSRDCFVCGRENPIGLKVRFHQRDNQVVTHFTPGPEHQGYPDRMHGGIAATLLDETIGRAGFIHGYWTFTAKFEVKYRKPIPLGSPITVVGEMVRDRGRFIEGRGEVLLADGSVAIEGTGLFVKLEPEELKRLEEQLGGLDLWDGGVPPGPETIAVRGLEVDFARKEVRLGGDPVAVTPGEFRLLACLATNLGRVVSNSKLIKEMSGYDCSEQEAAEIVKVHVSRLRSKIDRPPDEPSFLANVRGFGYILERRSDPSRSFGG